VKGFLNSIIKSQFVRNVTIVASGTAVAQLVTMAFSPVITRLYGAEAFGVLGTFIAMVAIIAPVSGLTYPVAIVLPKKDEDAGSIARLSLYTGFALAVVVGLILLFLGHRILEAFQVGEIGNFIFLLPPVIIFSVWLQVNEQWLIRKQHFKLRAKVEAAKALVVNGAYATAGLIKPVAAVLLVISALGHGIHALMLNVGLGKKRGYAKQGKRALSLAAIRKLAKEYKDFPVYRAPQVFINAVSQSLPVLMLSAFFGPASAGFYTLGRRLLKMPTALIGKSVGDVFYPDITKAAHNKEDLTMYILNATLGLAAIGIIPFSIIVIAGPGLFEFVFGSEWYRAGEYARWMAFWLFFAFINRPSVMSLPVLKLQGSFLVYEIISVLLRVIALLTGFYFFENEVVTIMLFSFTGVVLNFYLITFTIFKSKHFYRKNN